VVPLFLFKEKAVKIFIEAFVGTQWLLIDHLPPYEDWDVRRKCRAAVEDNPDLLIRARQGLNVIWTKERDYN